MTTARRMTVIAWGAWCSLSAVASVARAEPAADDAADRCATLAESGQTERHAGRLLRARDAFGACAADACPGVVRHDCSRWMSELRTELPSVVLRARDARDRNVAGVRVYANGTLLVDELDGSPIDVDPGKYQLRFEARSGETTEQGIVITAGEQRRELSVRFTRALEPDGTVAPSPTPVVAPPPARSPSPAVAPLSPRTESGSTPSNTLALAFGAAGIASLGAFTYFEIAGQSRYHELDEGCGRTGTCPPEDVSSVRTQFVAAGSFLALSVVCLSVSTWQFLRSKNTDTTARIRPNLVFRF